MGDKTVPPPRLGLTLLKMNAVTDMFLVEPHSVADSRLFR